MKRRRMVLKISMTLAVAVNAYAQPMAPTAKATFTNDTVNPVPRNGAAAIYPSPITVAGVTGLTYHVSVRLHLKHPGPQKLSVLLKSPNGTAVMLMANIGGIPFGGNVPTNPVGIDDCAAAAFQSDQLRQGRYRPAYAVPATTMPAPAPAGPLASGLSAFNWASPNGTWELYAANSSASSGEGSQIDAWMLTIFSQAAPYPVHPARNPVPCSAPDYDGDGRTDIAVYRPETGEWFISESGASGAPRVVRWGAAASSGLGDVPVPADYDGDGITDIAVWRGSGGGWFMTASFSEFTPDFRPTDHLGIASLGDVPVPGDYNGDGQAEAAVYRASTGEWFIRYWPGVNVLSSVSWGSPAHGDFPARR
jgi:hypothetical protein